MKKVVGVLAVALGLALSFSVAAEPIPKSIRDSLMPGQTKFITLEQGVLKIALNVLSVGESTYRSIVFSAVCMPLWENPKLVPRIKQIAVLNDIGKQGFALQGGGKACVELGPMSREQSDKYYAANTVPCVAGTCRKQ